jgi:uncharacterized membrane protein YhiD involved in acid resistance
MAPVQIDQLPVLMRLGVALAIGLMTGLERGWEGRELHTAQRTAGLRTFAAIGLLGGVTAQLGGDNGAALIAALAIALGVVLAVGYWRESEIERDVSLTTSVAALVTYSLGALAGRGELLAASSSAVVLTMLLGFRPELHGLIRKIDREELLATLLAKINDYVQSKGKRPDEILKVTRALHDPAVESLRTDDDRGRGTSRSSAADKKVLEVESGGSQPPE